MPGWQKASFDDPDVTVEAKPKSVWRKGRLQLLPYLYGNKPRFTATVTANRDLVDPKPLCWFLLFSSGHVTHHPLELPDMREGGRLSFDVGDRLLGFTGDTLLAMCPGDHPGKSYHALYTFRTIAVEDVLRDVIIGGLVTALGILITLAA